MKVWVCFDVFGDGGYVGQVSGDVDLPGLPKAGDRVDIRRDIAALVQSPMPAALEVTHAGLVDENDESAGHIVAFEYIDLDSTGEAFEVCRLLQDELDLFCDTPLPHGDKYGGDAP